MNMKPAWNSVEEIQKKIRSGMIRWRWPSLMLFSRTLLFFAFGFVILIILTVFKSGQPDSQVTRWWTY